MKAKKKYIHNKKNKYQNEEDITKYELANELGTCYYIEVQKDKKKFDNNK